MDLGIPWGQEFGPISYMHIYICIYIYIIYIQICIYIYTIWLFNIAMENHIFFKGKPCINGPFCMAMLNNQRVYCFYHVDQYWILSIHIDQYWSCNIILIISFILFFILINTKWNFNFQSFESELTTTGQNFAGGKYAIYVWSIQTGNILEILTGHLLRADLALLALRKPSGAAGEW